MNTVYRIAKNTAVLLIAQVISYVISFVYILYLTRYLGPGKFGVLSFAIAFTGFFQIFTDFGLQWLLVREIARDKGQTAKYLYNGGAVKTILAVVTLILMFVTVSILGYGQETIFVVYLIGISVILNSFSQLFFAVLQAYEDMEIQGLGQIIHMLVMLAGIILGINMGFGLMGFGYVYLAASIVLVTYSFTAVKMKYFGTGGTLSSIRLGVDRHTCLRLFKGAFPFGLAGVFYTIYSTLDTIVLSVAKGDEAVGLYSAAYRIIQIFLIIPAMWGMSIFPIMSRFYISSSNSLKFAVEKSFKYLTVIAVPLGVGISLLADQIIFVLYGQPYSQSAGALQILIWADVLFLMDYSFTILLMACNRQKLNTMTLGLCALMNAVLNFIFIPQFGYMAAAVILLLTQFISLVVHYVLSLRTGYLFGRRTLAGILLRTVFVCVLMGIFVKYFQGISMVAVIPSAIILYFIGIILVGGLGKEDFRLIKNAMHRPKS